MVYYWSTRPTGCDHYFYTGCPSVCLTVHPSVPKFQNQAKTIAGRDCGLVEWIILMTSFLFFFLILNILKCARNFKAQFALLPHRPRPIKWSLFHTWCPSVRKSTANMDVRKTKYALQWAPCVKKMTTYWLWPCGSS